MIVNPSSGGSGTIADGSITEAKLDANLTNKVNAVGSVAEGSITSFHIATGSILGTDICGNTITYANIANDAVTNTKIANGAVTHAKLSSNCVESHNILDGTILGTDICGNTITSFNIADGTILGTDISNGTITQAKLHPDIQLFLAEVGQSIYNLENRGFWGTFKFTNDNSSDTGATLIITAEKRYYNSPTNTYEIQSILPSPETITKGNHYTITIPEGERLINDITIIRMYYTINKTQIEVVNNVIFDTNDKSSDVNGDYYDFIFDSSYADNNGGNAEISFTIANSI